MCTSHLPGWTMQSWLRWYPGLLASLKTRMKCALYSGLLYSLTTRLYRNIGSNSCRISLRMSGFCATSRTDSNRENRQSMSKSCLLRIMYKYITMYLFKFFFWRIWFQMESDRSFWIGFWILIFKLSQNPPLYIYLLVSVHVQRTQVHWLLD